MQGKENLEFGETEARQILNAGWRQGSIFRPPASFPVPVQFDRDCELLVVCTQSCTLVSPNLPTSPHIEFIVAKPVDKYHPKSDEATGKNLHCFHLPISGIPNTEAVACDINRRFFVGRAVCLSHSPDLDFTTLGEGVRNFAGWIMRYYTRIALPDELVRRAKLGLFACIKNALNDKLEGGDKLSNGIYKIYIDWTPDLDLQDGFYKVYILFLCADVGTDIRLNSLLGVPLEPFTDDDGHDGIKLEYESKNTTETFVSELVGYKRLTEWDYLSNLGDVADSEN
jgi:hypothetical protein